MTARPRRINGDPSIFLDTHGLLAALNLDDAHHARAVHMLDAFATNGIRVCTSDWVLAEFLSVAARPPLRLKGAGLVAMLRSSELTTVVEASRTGWEQAFELFRSRRDKAWSFVDCSSILLCRERGIAKVLTHDHHFRQAGLQPLL